MKRIFKYELQTVDDQNFTLHNDSQILSVAEQNDGVVMYAMVDADQPKTLKVNVKILGTGHAAVGIEQHRFLGTVNTHEGQLMWHVFVKDE